MKKDMRNISYWNKRGITYGDLDDVKSSRTAYKIIEMIRPLGLNSGSWILDAGCGGGYITKIIRDRIRHSNVVGVDLSRKMIEVASVEESPGLKFIAVDFFRIISEIYSFFNLVIMSLFLHHLTELV